MKRKLVTLAIIALLSGAAASAQTTIKPHIGFNLTDVQINSNSNDVSASGKAGVLAGLSVAFGKKIYFEPGLQYVAKSTEYISTDDPNFPDGTESFNLKGFRIPLAVGINLLGNEKSLLTLHGFGGVSAFFVTNNNYDFDIKKTNWGVFAGAGVDIWKLFLDMSYEWSVTDISGIDNVNVGKTRSLYVNAGFRFNL